MASENYATEDVGMMRKGSESRRGDWMQVAGGGRFWPLDPRPEEVSLEVIAHHLSRFNRYGGAIELENYSVAEHATLMAAWVFQEYGDAKLALQALHHDDPEAYCGDIIRPIKRQPEMSAFEGIEFGIWCAIAMALDLPLTLDDRIKDADNRILVNEKLQVMADGGLSWGIDHLEPLHGLVVQGWTPNVAKEKYLEMHARLHAELA